MKDTPQDRKLKQQDLRKGNYVMSLFEIEPRKELFIDQVRYYDEEKEYLFTECAESPLEWFEAVPLTPEILERCGFIIPKSFGEGNYNQKFHNLEITINVERRLVWLDVKDWQIKIKRALSCLHELQNFVHALTGHELTLKAEG